jgi:hypothetical protein
MTKCYIGLPNGKRSVLPTYCAAWRTLKTLDPKAQVKGWDDFPADAADVLRDMRAGLADRINRHIPGYGRGRKWDARYQLELRRDARRVNEYAARRIVYPVNGLSTPELQRRFRWNHTHDGLDIILLNRDRRQDVPSHQGRQ